MRASLNTTGHTNIEEEKEVYFYQAVVSYLTPYKHAIGIEAYSMADAEQMVKEMYGTHLNFELLSIEPARDDIKRNWVKGITN